MELKITQIKGSFHYVRYNGSEYILHNSWISPKSYFSGKKTDRFSIVIRKAGQNEEANQLNNPKLGLLVIAIVIQPFVGIMYRILTILFHSHNIGGNIFMKFLMFCLSGVVAFLFYKVIYFKETKKYRLSEIPKNELVKLTFKTDGKRHFGLSLIFVVLNMITLISYLLWSNPQSGTILILTTLFFFAIFVFSWRIVPIGVHHQIGYLIFEKEEVL